MGSRAICKPPGDITVQPLACLIRFDAKLEYLAGVHHANQKREWNRFQNFQSADGQSKARCSTDSVTVPAIAGIRKNNWGLNVAVQYSNLVRGKVLKPLLLFFRSKQRFDFLGNGFFFFFVGHGKLFNQQIIGGIVKFTFTKGQIFG